jgi:cytosine/adenosine deaminase-related metal-dependent hydrolase
MDASPFKTPAVATPTFALRARWVLPCAGDDRPIDGGIVTVREGRIVSVGTVTDLPAALVQDLGDVALLPGLVNAHTHLEFSDLAAPLGRPGQALSQWIGEVVAYRRAKPTSGCTALERGYEECRASGAVAVGEISTRLEDATFAPPGLVRFHEVICPVAERWPAVLSELIERLSQPSTARQGISPHAPYTLTWSVFDELVHLATDRNFPWAMHLAESPEELELLATGGGGFRTLLESAGVWSDTARPLGLAPVDYLRRLAAAPQSLVVHGNYLDEPAWRFLAEHADRMAVVYCPRTHAYFGHQPYPLAQMLTAGVRVCLGTDSRASNPDLNLFSELQFAVRQHSDVSPRQLLQMATTAAADFFQQADMPCGITAAAAAQLVAVQLPSTCIADPYELLADEQARVVQVWY